MPVEVHTPISTGTQNNWKFGGAASKVAAVATDDGTTSLIWAASGGKILIQEFNFPPYSDIVDPVNAASLTARTRCGEKGVGGRVYYLRWNGAGIENNRAVEVVAVRPAFKTVTESLSGANLALSAVNGQHGLRFSAAGGPSQKAEFWVTHLYRTVNFDYPAGSGGTYARYIGSILGFAIGTGLLLREMPDLSRLMWSRGGYLIRKDEYERAWRAWNARKALVVV